MGLHGSAPARTRGMEKADLTVLEGIIQGILQGLAEFLPISSSGHLAVFQHFFGISEGHSVTVFLHLGTLLSVFVAFFRPLWGLVCELGAVIRDIFTGRFRLGDMTARRRMLAYLIISCLPLLAVYPLRGVIGGLSEDGSVVLEGICFLFSGLFITVGSWLAPKAGQGKSAAELKPFDAFAVGIAQAAATLPGLSRSGTTISAALTLGCERESAFEYSFLLGTPAVLAATAGELADALRGGAASASSTELWAVALGTVAAAVVGIFAIRLVGSIVKSKRFAWFGYYCFAVGAAVLIAAGCGL